MIRKPGLLLAVFFMVVVAHAQDSVHCVETIGGVYDEASQNCIEQGTIEIDIQYPAWILDYPYIVAVVQPYISQIRADYLNSGLNFWQERDLFLQISYQEYHYSDEIVTLVFRSLVDDGGLYPVGSVRTFTFDLSDEKQLMFSDLISDEHNTVQAIKRRIAEEACFECLRIDAVDNASFENFILTEDELIFLYPPVRMGAINAGIIEVVFSISELEERLLP